MKFVLCLVVLSFSSGSLYAKDPVQILDYEKLFGLSDKEEEQKYICSDIVFALDSSCSVKRPDRINMITVIENVVKGAKVHPNLARFGLVRFDYGATKIFGLGEYFSAEEILKKLSDVKKEYSLRRTIAEKCKTFTWEALRMVRVDDDLLGSEKRYNEKTGEERKRVVVIMTDGRPYNTSGPENEEAVKALTLKEGNLNTENGIQSMVVQVPHMRILENDTDIFTKLVTKKEWFIQIAVGVDLQDAGKYFFHELVKNNGCSYKCLGKIDLCFVMDRSDSILEPDIKKTKEFFQDLGDSFLVGYDGNKKGTKFTNAMIGALSYNQWVSTHFMGYQCKDNACVRRNIGNIPATNNRYTETDLALKAVLDTCLDKFSTRGYGISRVAILATDGNTWKTDAKSINSARTIAMANKLREAGIDVEVIGLPNYQEIPGINEWKQTASHFVFDLRRIAGADHSSNWTMPTFEDLKAINGIVARKICKEYTDVGNDI
ncbi:unnamed protein product [Owenia fusiformis]|uniref:Uncharacterized protein n=1 Tax=Owenia fusiformis TaxID=6347 RepID=A0A8J1UN64_OWEFU|nr:unnamed protein product [Owenia fusiformis]